jgi:GNAT superfamily N-acetyltransferase
MGPGTPRPGPPFRVWYARRREPGGDGFTVTAIQGDRHPDRTVVDTDTNTDNLEAEGRPLYRARYRDGWMVQVTVEPSLVPEAPALWYVEVGEPEAEPPAMVLVAFATDHFPDGTVMAASALDEHGLERDHQIGALRWWVLTGQVHQIYVAPSARRRGVGTKLSLAGAAYCRGPGWPSLWGTGEVTDLGEAWIDRAVWRGRVEQRSRRVPPMTPDDEAVGVPRRNLFPEQA